MCFGFEPYNKVVQLARLVQFGAFSVRKCALTVGFKQVAQTLLGCI